MLFSVIRIWNKGWIKELYIDPSFHFSYYGFEWIKPIGDYTYLIFLICAISSFCVAIGYKYRTSIILLFLIRDFYFDNELFTALGLFFCGVLLFKLYSENRNLTLLVLSILLFILLKKSSNYIYNLIVGEY